MPSPRGGSHQRSPSPSTSQRNSPASRPGSAPPSPKITLNRSDTDMDTTQPAGREASERIASLERALQAQDSSLKAKEDL
eukprot:scaffold636750_cov45-Prasinocladus_malaysianus.AAC.1